MRNLGCPDCAKTTAGDCGKHNENKSMLMPYKCPVCDGTGLVSRPPYIAGDIQTWSGNKETYPCKACVNGILWA